MIFKQSGVVDEDGSAVHDDVVGAELVDREVAHLLCGDPTAYISNGDHGTAGAEQVLADAYATTVRAQYAILAVRNTQIDELQGQVEAHFGEHPDAMIYLSRAGLGVVLGARMLAEFGDYTGRYADAPARKNYAGTSPVTRQSGKKKHSDGAT